MISPKFGCFKGGGSGGGGGATEYAVFYCSARDGDDGTGDGSAAKPYATATNAFGVWAGLNAPGRIHVIDGNVGPIEMDFDMDNPLLLTGNGAGCVISAVNANGFSPAASAGDYDGVAAGGGYKLDFVSDGTVFIGNMNGIGGTGGDAGNGDDGSGNYTARNGGDGGRGSKARLRGVFNCGNLNFYGGIGGQGNASGDGSGRGGNGGAASLVVMDGLFFCDYLNVFAGVGGSSPGGNSGFAGDGPASCFFRGVRSRNTIDLTNADGGCQLIDCFSQSTTAGNAFLLNSGNHGALPSWP